MIPFSRQRRQPQHRQYAYRLVHHKRNHVVSHTAWQILLHKKRWIGIVGFGGTPIPMPYCLPETMKVRCLYIGLCIKAIHRPYHPSHHRNNIRTTVVHSIMKAMVAATDCSQLLRLPLTLLLKTTGIPLPEK